MDINHYNNEFINIWNCSKSNFPQFQEVSIDEKARREEEMINFSRSLRSEVDFKKLDKTARAKFIQQFQTGFNSFFKSSFGFTEQETALVTDSGLMGITKEFMTMARTFDPEVKIDDVFQASRNLWIINSLQIMMGAEVKLSKSIFAYSMLYPYSDNYLDDPAISNQEKIEFSARFRQRLEGIHVIPANDHEKIIFDLVGMIECDWEREQYPGVYESLLAIHDAQTKSIVLLSRKNNLSDDDLLLICIEKGGTSVLADGYLINGTLTPGQEWFCFGFGAFLQFVDDIQDIKEDSEGALETVFTTWSKGNKLDEMVNRAIDFGATVMGDLSCFGDKDMVHMSSLMIKSNTFLLSEAVGLNPNFYSNSYVDGFEKFSPFSYEFVRKRRSSMESNRISLMKKIGSFVFDDTNALAMQA